jgi:hypothetical protein
VPIEEEHSVCVCIYVCIYIYTHICVCVCVRASQYVFCKPYHEQTKIFLAVKEIRSFFFLRKYPYKNMHFVGSMPEILKLSKCVLLLLFLDGKMK